MLCKQVIIPVQPLGVFNSKHLPLSAPEQPTLGLRPLGVRADRLDDKEGKEKAHKSAAGDGGHQERREHAGQPKPCDHARCELRIVVCNNGMSGSMRVRVQRPSNHLSHNQRTISILDTPATACTPKK